MESIFEICPVSIYGNGAFIARPVTLDDAEAMFEYASDRENTLHFSNKSKLRRNQNNIAQFYLAGPLGRWGIELKAMVSLLVPLTLQDRYCS